MRQWITALASVVAAVAAILPYVLNTQYPAVIVQTVPVPVPHSQPQPEKTREAPPPPEKTTEQPVSRTPVVEPAVPPATVPVVSGRSIWSDAPAGTLPEAGWSPPSRASSKPVDPTVPPCRRR